MAMGTVELEPEVRDWLESLSTSQFATAAFYVDLIAARVRCLASRIPVSWMASCVSCGSISKGGRCG
jgi:hypothetical protein